MVLELLPAILAELANLDTTLLLVLVVIGVVVAAKIFQYLMKAIFVGVIFGALPVVLTFLGLEMEITLQSIASSALFGIAIFLVYAAVHTGLKVTKIILYPFRRFFGKKKKPEKIIVREVREKKEKD